jgi:hypothetical protein
MFNRSGCDEHIPPVTSKNKNIKVPASQLRYARVKALLRHITTCNAVNGGWVCAVCRENKFNADGTPNMHGGQFKNFKELVRHYHTVQVRNDEDLKDAHENAEFSQYFPFFPAMDI